MLILNSCFTLKPDSSGVSSKDYNNKQEISYPKFVKKRNPIGVTFNVALPLMAGAAMYQFAPPIVKYQDGSETKGFQPANAVVGVIGMLCLTKIFDYALGYNKTERCNESSAVKWMKETNLSRNYNFVAEDRASKLFIIPKSNENNYIVKNITDVSYYRNLYPNASNGNITAVVQKAITVLDNEDLVKLISYYPENKACYQAKIKYITTAKNYVELWNRAKTYPDAKPDMELLASNLVVLESEYEEYKSKFSSKTYYNIIENRLLEIDNKAFNEYANVNTIDSYNSYLRKFANPHNKQEALNRIENINAEIRRNEEVARKAEEERQRKLAFYKPQIDAYNLLASKYANKYKSEISPKTGKQPSFEFVNNDFDKDQRSVKLKWMAAKFSNVFFSAPMEQFEIEGMLNVREGTFEWATSNSAVSAAQNFSGLLKLSGEFIGDALKSLPQSDYSNYSSSTSSSNSESSNNLSVCETDCLKEFTKEKIKSTRAWEKRSLSQSQKQLIEFSDGYYGFIFKDEHNNYYIDTNGTGLDYYKDYDSVVFSLYVYKRCGNVAKTNKSN